MKDVIHLPNLLIVNNVGLIDITVVFTIYAIAAHIYHQDRRGLSMAQILDEVKKYGNGYIKRIYSIGGHRIMYASEKNCGYSFACSGYPVSFLYIEVDGAWKRYRLESFFTFLELLLNGDDSAIPKIIRDSSEYDWVGEKEEEDTQICGIQHRDGVQSEETFETDELKQRAIDRLLEGREDFLKVFGDSEK